MKILFLTDNFPPETNAPATRTHEHAREWVKGGHEVTVITCAPNFPSGKVFHGYRNAWYQTENIDGIHVVRVKTYITANAGFALRTLDYLSFMVMGFIAGLIQRRPDVVVGTSPQFFTVCAAWLLSVSKFRPFVFELRDLWPASIVTVGAMRDNFAVRALHGLEIFLYRRADTIIPVTQSFKRELISRGITADKIAVVINGVDTTRYTPIPRDPELLQRYQLQGKFVVGYLGTHGMAHALDKVLEAAQLLHNEPDIVFLFVGGGAKRQALLEQAGRLQLTNVRMVESQPKELMPRLWSLCDVTVIPLKNDPIFTTVIPSKIFECMGTGIPMIMSLPEGEATQIIRDTGTGICIPPENPPALQQAILQLCNHPDQLTAMQQACGAAAPRFNRKAQAQRMQHILEQTAAGNGQSVAERAGNPY
jgi:glycosyltransferase involved in cell wall biosynthesis